MRADSAAKSLQSEDVAVTPAAPSAVASAVALGLGGGCGEDDAAAAAVWSTSLITRDANFVLPAAGTNRVLKRLHFGSTYVSCEGESHPPKTAML